MYAAPIKRPREVVYDTVKRRIMMNEMNPEVGLTELGLARELGCSQGTVREALLRLQEDGLVARAGHRGTTITRIDPEEADEILGASPPHRNPWRAARRAERHAGMRSIASRTIPGRHGGRGAKGRRIRARSNSTWCSISPFFGCPASKRSNKSSSLHPAFASLEALGAAASPTVA